MATKLEGATWRVSHLMKNWKLTLKECAVGDGNLPSFIRTLSTKLRVDYVPQKKKTEFPGLNLSFMGNSLTVTYLSPYSNKKSSLWIKFIIHFHILSYKPPSVSCFEKYMRVPKPPERLLLSQQSAGVGTQEKLWSSLWPQFDDFYLFSDFSCLYHMTTRAILLIERRNLNTKHNRWM